VLSEFGKDTLVLIANDQGELVLETNVEKLLPSAFGPVDLNS
jgi:cytidine deaminase